MTVGRFDRMNLFLSSQSNRYHIFDNNTKAIVNSGELKAVPIGSQGSVDGRTTWIAASTWSMLVAALRAGDGRRRTPLLGSRGLDFFRGERSRSEK